MSEFEKISDESTWERCLEEFDYFHDSILREAYLVSKGYVTPDRRMFDDTACDARLFFQSQDDRAPGLELIVEGVTEFRLASMVVLEPSLTIGRDGIELALGGDALRDRSLIVAGSAKYRILQADVLGDQLRIGSPIPIDPP